MVSKKRRIEDVDKLRGKTITEAGCNDSVLALQFSDGTYFAVMADEEGTGAWLQYDEPLDPIDKHDVGLTSDDEWATYQAECKRRSKANAERARRAMYVELKAEFGE